MFWRFGGEKVAVTDNVALVDPIVYVVDWFRTFPTVPEDANQVVNS